MNRREMTGTRDLTFSAWHRDTFGDAATAIDIDLLGYCDPCGRTLYVIEATRQEHKSTRVLNVVADVLRVPAFLVRYGTAGGRLVDFRAHYALPDGDGRRPFIGHEREFVAVLEHLRAEHANHCTEGIS